MNGDTVALPSSGDDLPTKINKLVMKHGIWAALITAFASLGVAGIQYVIAPNLLEGRFAFLFDKRLPLGTIVASMLEPKEFAAVAGDPGTFDPRNSAWLPADGREVAGSSYAKRVNPIVPDLRGSFLRGLNYTDSGRVRTDGKQDPDGDGRKAGDYQADEFKKHSHPYKKSFFPGAGKSGAGSPDVHSAHQDTQTGDVGGAETRPRNTAVYYYIKVN